MEPPLVEHGLALALGGRCPLCAELAADVGVLALRPCSTCGGTFATPELAERLVDEVASRSRERLLWHLGVLALAGLLLGFVPLLGAAAIGIGLMVFQLRVVTPALSLLSRRRRRVARWTLRLFTSTLGLVSMVGVTLASLVGVGGWVTAPVAPLTVGVVWTLARSYLLWQLRREREGAPVSPLELALLGGAAAAVGAAIVASLALTWAAAALLVLVRDEVLRLLSRWG
ncbi:MAG: hypothetical protein IT374_18260 [Polyangiaceae bacterium]|nr:hypothetical protein [Polyangiaceae bacterium]